jgi:hypothetical protein
VAINHFFDCPLMKLRFVSHCATVVILSTALASCGWFSDPPTQLESAMTVSAVATDKKDREVLLGEVLQYLAVGGLSFEQARVVYDDQTKRNLFRVVGKEALAPALLQQIANRLAGYGAERNWHARLVIDDSEHALDKLLKTSKREFDIALNWGQADIDAYVVREMASPYPSIESMTQSQPKTVLCMLSFRPKESLPDLEYSLADVMAANGEQTTSDAVADRMTKQMMDMFKNMGSEIAHQLTFEAPLLDSSFGQDVRIKDGKLMFKYASIESTTVFDPTTAGAPMDFGGSAHRDCERRLEADFPSVNRRFVQREFFNRVEAFAPATLVGAGK